MTQLLQLEREFKREVIGNKNFSIELMDYESGNTSLNITVYRDVKNNDFKNFTVYLYDFNSIDKLYKQITLIRKMIKANDVTKFDYFKSQNRKIEKA